MGRSDVGVGLNFQHNNLEMFISYIFQRLDNGDNECVKIILLLNELVYV